MKDETVFKKSIGNILPNYIEAINCQNMYIGQTNLSLKNGIRNIRIGLLKIKIIQHLRIIYDIFTY